MLNVFVAIIIAITWIALEKLITTYLSGRVDKYEKKEEINTYPFVIKQTVLIRIFNFITLAVVILAAIVVNVLLYQDILNHYGFVILFNFVLLLFFINHLYSSSDYCSYRISFVLMGIPPHDYSNTYKTRSTQQVVACLI